MFIQLFCRCHVHDRPLRSHASFNLASVIGTPSAYIKIVLLGRARHWQALPRRTFTCTTDKICIIKFEHNAKLLYYFEPLYELYSMASPAQTQPHFQFTCADPITNGVLYYKVFLCHVDLQTASRDERWPIKTLLYHSSAHKYCVLSASVMCHLRLHACLILQQAMLSGYGTFVMYSNFMPHTPLLTKGCY